MAPSSSTAGVCFVWNPSGVRATQSETQSSFSDCLDRTTGYPLRQMVSPYGLPSYPSALRTFPMGRCVCVWSSFHFSLSSLSATVLPLAPKSLYPRCLSLSACRTTATHRVSAENQIKEASRLLGTNSSIRFWSSLSFYVDGNHGYEKIDNYRLGR